MNITGSHCEWWKAKCTTQPTPSPVRTTGGNGELHRIALFIIVITIITTWLLITFVFGDWILVANFLGGVYFVDNGA